MPTDCTAYFDELRRTPMNFFLMAALTSDKMTSLVSKNCKDRKHIVCLTINGVEVDVEHAVKRFSDGLDEAVNKRALEVMKEKCSDIMNTINDLQKSIKEMTKKRLGIELEKDDWE